MQTGAQDLRRFHVLYNPSISKTKKRSPPQIEMHFEKMRKRMHNAGLELLSSLHSNALVTCPKDWSFHFCGFVHLYIGFVHEMLLRDLLFVASNMLLRCKRGVRYRFA